MCDSMKCVRKYSYTLLKMKVLMSGSQQKWFRTVVYHQSKEFSFQFENLVSRAPVVQTCSHNSLNKIRKFAHE